MVAIAVIIKNMIILSVVIIALVILIVIQLLLGGYYLMMMMGHKNRRADKWSKIMDTLIPKLLIGLPRGSRIKYSFRVDR